LDSLPIGALLKKYGIRPDKRLGQNFLIDEGSLARIAATGEIQPGDRVLEIGPGLGSLTRHLARQAGQVVAVELDPNLIPPLNEVLTETDNVQVVQGDILALRPDELIDQPDYIVVANIPYYITSAIIRHLLEAEHKPRRIVLTIQEEVARRICASAGDYSLLALSVQVYGQAQIAGRIPAGAFFPAPKVDSAIVRVDLYNEPVVATFQLKTFFQLIHAGFAMKRKTLRNTLSAGMHWEKEKVELLLNKAGIDPQRRAQTLTLDEWKHLTGIVFEGIDG
jgi:16S rRNA (adenine1518-N6/adenine1519-N6)-dimethyltransferase